METRNAPMVGRNSPRNANTPKMSAGCTPISQSNTPIDNAGDDAIDGDPARPGDHLSHQSREGAMGLLAITIGRQREIRSYERPRTDQDKNKQQHCENEAGHSAHQTEGRSQQNAPDCSGGRTDLSSYFITAWQRFANCRIVLR